MAEISPSQIANLLDTTYMNWLDPDLKRAIRSNSPAMKKNVVSLAILNRKYNAAAEILRTDLSGFSELTALAQISERVQDMETLCELWKKARNNEGVFGVNTQVVQERILQLEENGWWKLVEETLGDVPLTKQDYGVPQSIEDENENYPEVLEFQAAKKAFNYDLNKMQVYISGMLGSYKIDENVIGHAFVAECSMENRQYEQAMRFYLTAARLCRNKAIYFGFAGNAAYRMARTDFENGKVEDVKTCLMFARLLTYRAIHLDYTNPRWHYYVALIAGLMSTWNGKNGQSQLAAMECSNALDEILVAEAFLRHKAGGLTESISMLKKVFQKQMRQAEAFF